MTDGAAPIANVVGNRWVCAEGLWHRLIRETRLRDSLMAGRASIDDVHSGKPDLIDVGAVVRQQFFLYQDGLAQIAGTSVCIASTRGENP